MSATKDFSSKQESLLASKLGWSVVSGSGARPTAPGDIISDDWLGECKTHVKQDDTITFRQDVWNKICREAVMKHRKPVLFVDDGTQTEDGAWALCKAGSLPVVSELTVAKYDKSIVKHITFSHSAATDHLLSVKKLEGKMYAGLSAVWPGIDRGFDKVIIMPFTTFKEIYDL